MAEGLPRSVEEVVDAVRELAAAGGREIYLVGGFVRDRLLGRGSHEVDLISTGDGGLDLLARLAGRFGWAPPAVFERFGTAQVRGDGVVVEMVRARAERYDPESRRPAVRPGTLDEDIWRRDFTVNALCQTLDGRVVDLTGRGLPDLFSGSLRTPLAPAETFSEDPLRMFRAARFVAQLGFRPAPGLVEAMRDQATRARILSVERINVELRKLLVARHPRAGMEVLRAGGLIDVVAPELAAMVGVEQSGWHVHDVWDHTMHALDAAPADLVTRLATLLHDVGKPPCHALAADGRHTFHGHPAEGARLAADLLRRLQFTIDETRQVACLVELHLRPIQYGEDFGDAAVRRLIRDAGPLRGRLLDVARADTRASAYPDVANIDALEERMARLDAGERFSRLVSPLDGDEIMALAGRGPGKWIAAVKQQLEDSVIEGVIAPGDKDAARALLRARPGLLEGS